MGRCLLIDSNLPKEMWPYAISTATYIRNRYYQQRTKHTPYFLLTGKAPDISNLYVFGSTCYAYDQSEKKLDPRSKKGVFVGYDRCSPSYLVYFSDSSSIRRYRCLRCFNKRYYKVETHDDEHMNDDEDEFIVPNIKVELIPADTSASTTESVHDEADDILTPVVAPENVVPVLCEVDPQQNDEQLIGGGGGRYGWS